MSTDYIADNPINLEALGNFNHQGVWVDTKEEDGVILTDGTHYLHAETNPEIYSVNIDHETKEARLDYSHQYQGIMFTRYGRNDPEKIIAAIEDYFKVKLVSEHEEAFDELAG